MLYLSAHDEAWFITFGVPFLLIKRADFDETEVLSPILSIVLLPNIFLRSAISEVK